MTALERLLAGGGAGIAARIALYRSVVAEVDALEARPLIASAPKGDSDAVQRNLGALTPVGRQAFLLVAMEQFTISDAALVLEMTPEVVSSLLEDANEDIAAQLATDVVVIEDEPLIAMDLRQLLQDLGHRVVRVARTKQQAIDAVEQTRPGLVLADIQLADGSSGLDAVNEFLETIAVPVIFVTAFPERLLTGVKPEPAFLVSKPFLVDQLEAVINQALFFDVRSRLASAKTQYWTPTGGAFLVTRASIH